MTPEQKDSYAPLCPDAVFEVRSKSDALDDLRKKMQGYLDNGAKLAVLVDPYDRFVEVYRPMRQPKIHANDSAIELDPELPGFILDTSGIFTG
ncbi:MAG: Uma2 family endonuclease [Vulcanimicrobiaceae bacterium]